jgi:hypothetical protein
MGNAYRDCGKKTHWNRDSLWRYEELRELMCVFLMSPVYTLEYKTIFNFKKIGMLQAVLNEIEFPR